MYAAIEFPRIQYARGHHMVLGTFHGVQGRIAEWLPCAGVPVALQPMRFIASLLAERHAQTTTIIMEAIM